MSPPEDVMSQGAGEPGLPDKRDIDWTLGPRIAFEGGIGSQREPVGLQVALGTNSCHIVALGDKNVVEERGVSEAQPEVPVGVDQVGGGRAGKLVKTGRPKGTGRVDEHKGIQLVC